MKILAVGSMIMLIYTLLVSLWILFNSTTASRLLLNYEDATKKAAKITSKASEQLRRTRMTQGAGMVASVATTTSAVLAIYMSLTSTGLSGESLQRILFFMGVGNSALCLWVRRYMGRFWGGSARVPLPGATEYNDAVRATEFVMSGLKIVAMGWASIMAVNWEWN